MWQLITTIVLFVLACKMVIVIRSFEFMPLSELKRRARKGDQQAETVYHVRLYGVELWSLLWVVVGLSTAGIVLLLDAIAWAWLALLIDVPILVLLHAILPWAKSPAPSLKPAFKAAPYIVIALKLFHPFWKRTSIFIARWLEPETLKIIHSKEQLIEMLENSVSLEDQVSKDELVIAENALQFGDKKILDHMTPLSVVRMVQDDETLGPVLLNELYESGFSRFPVYGENQQSIVGVLYIKDIVKHRENASVHEVAKKEVYYVNESYTLDHALKAFLHNHHHMSMVVNQFEEIVGVITLEDVIEQILGKEIVDEFDQYEDLRAVAALRAHHLANTRTEVQNQSPPQKK